jgi:hypothetical protein
MNGDADTAGAGAERNGSPEPRASGQGQLLTGN